MRPPEHGELRNRAFKLTSFVTAVKVVSAARMSERRGKAKRSSPTTSLKMTCLSSTSCKSPSKVGTCATDRYPLPVFSPLSSSRICSPARGGASS
eukprot:748639-Hanusia_phi.AAC.4